MADLRRFYLVFDPDKKCCSYIFSRYVSRVMEFMLDMYPLERDENAGYILVDAGREVVSNCFDGFDGVWKLVEEKDFDRSNLVIKTLPGICDECRLRRHC